MGMTSVVNIKTGAAYDVYVGRGRGGVWGNPFSHNGKKSKFVLKYVFETREEAIEAHRQWLWRQIKSGAISLEDLAALHGKTLGCFCKPEACHGDTLAAAADWAFEQLQPKRVKLAERTWRIGVETLWQEGDRFFASLRNRTYSSEHEIPAESAQRRLAVLTGPRPDGRTS